MPNARIILLVVGAVVVAACASVAVEEAPSTTMVTTTPSVAPTTIAMATTTSTVAPPTIGTPAVDGVRVVPSAYPSVQAAADAAVRGDDIVVATGTPIPSLVLTTPDVRIRSSEQPTAVGGVDFVTTRFEVEVERDVVYAEGAVAGGTKELELDIYLPEDDPTPNRPALVAIHGGGFVTGTRGDLVVSAVCRSLAARGQVCVSISYRLVPDEPPGDGPRLVRAIDAAVEDAVAAVGWVRANAERLSVDPDRVSIGGSSAGAITALLVGFGPDGVPVHRVVDLWGGLFAEVDEVAAGGPPVLIVHGTADETVEFDQAVQLMDALSGAGVPFEAYAFPGAGHGIGPGTAFDGEPILDIIATFLGT